MSPAPITQNGSPSPKELQPQQSAPVSGPSPLSKHFDDIFHFKFIKSIQEYKDDPHRPQLTGQARKAMIETAYHETDEIYFGNRQLSDKDIKLRCLTKLFYVVLAEEPWAEDWIRAPDVERKLSKFEMHKDSVELAAKYGIETPRDAVRAAREALVRQEEALKNAKDDKEVKIDRGPFDDIEIIYIAGTVSSTATNRIDRESIYPVAISSVAHTLQNHICRDMVRPFAMAERFVDCYDTKELEAFRQFACNVCDYCPHLLDNDNVSLLVVLLILSRSDCCRRFENNGIRIEGSTISHRKAECMTKKLGWRKTEERKPYDTFALEFQTRVKNACFPAPRAQRVTTTRKPIRKSSGPVVTPGTGPLYQLYQPQPQIHQYPPHLQAQIHAQAQAQAQVQAQGQQPHQQGPVQQLPPIGFVAPPQMRPEDQRARADGPNSGINVPAPTYTMPSPSHSTPKLNGKGKQRASTGGAAAGEGQAGQAGDRGGDSTEPEPMDVDEKGEGHTRKRF